MKASKTFVALLAAAGICLLPACGSDDDSSSEGSQAASETASVTFEATERGDRVAIDGPSQIEAGVVEVTLRNSGEGDHDGQLVRVTGDQTADQVVEAIAGGGPDSGTPEWARGAGGVGLVPAGEERTVTEVLEPGSYYLLDTVSGEGEGGGPANASKGGVAEFEVTGEADGELPETDATVTAVDYSFETSGLEAGSNSVTFRNTGDELHHMLAFPIREGATFAEAREAFQSEEPPEGPPPVDFEGVVDTAVIDGGEEQVVELDFEPGKYALVCFIPDRAGGPPHAAMGMVSELDVE